MRKNITQNISLKQNRLGQVILEKRVAIAEIICALFILLFVYAATSKFFEFANFRNILLRSPLIGRYASYVAWILPLVELLAALLLLLPRTRLLGLKISFIVMSVFTLYIGYMLIFAQRIPCSCGGVLKQMNWPQHFIFNIFFTLLALFGVLLVKDSPVEEQ